MTTRDQARRSLRRSADADRSFEVLQGDAGPSLPERLTAAREARGVDLYRAERDTKIRAKYLQALERGDYGELPADVYTKGFLRNYSTYLGIDPDDAIAQWRRERGESAPSKQVAIVPKAVVTPREGITLSRGLLGFLLLLAVVGVVVAFLALRLVPYLQPLEVNVSTPSIGYTTVAANATSFTFSGTSTAGITIQITVDGTSVSPVLVDSRGKWTYTGPLHKGTNEFSFTAANPETNHSSKTVIRQVNVPIPLATAPVAPELSIDSPPDGATLQNGAVAVKGKTNATRVTVRSTYLGAPTASPSPGASGSAAPGASPSPSPKPTATPKPSAKPSGSPGASPSPSASAAPPATTIPIAADGTFSTTLQLSAGRWQIAIEAEGGEGQTTTSVTRTVTVAYQGLQVQVTIKGSPAWIHVVADGKAVSTVPDRVYRVGETFTITATQSVQIRTGRPDATTVVVNGVTYGPLSSGANPATFNITPGQPPKQA